MQEKLRIFNHFHYLRKENSKADFDAILMTSPVGEATAFLVKDLVPGKDIAVMNVRKQKDLSENYLRRYLPDHRFP